LKNKNAQGALDLAEQAESLNPGFYQNAMLRGRALLALGRSSEAVTALELALAEHPAFLKEQQQIEQLLQQARNPK
jgi:tetratricopeptide (TPR) repeat protein